MGAQRRPGRRAFVALSLIGLLALSLFVLEGPATRSPTPILPRTCGGPLPQLGAVSAATGVAHLPDSLALGLSANVRSTRGEGRCLVLSEILATGIRWIREDLSWATLEPRPGTLNFRAYDALLAFADRYGIRVLPLIDDSPTWAAPTPDTLPADAAAYGRVVSAVAQRYGPHGKFWRAHPALPYLPVRWLEIYNEPYGAGQDPGTYARLVRTASVAARGADPGVHVIAAVGSAAWLERMLSAVPDLFRYASAVSEHPYSTRPPDAPPALHATREVELVHRVLLEHHDGWVPIWITEIGWSTCPANPACVGSEQLQAKYLRETLRLAGTRWAGYVRALFVYTLLEFPQRALDQTDRWFGLIRPDGSPKPAWQVLAATARYRQQALTGHAGRSP